MTNAIIGFSLVTGLAPERRHRALAAQRTALAPFATLTHQALSLGVSHLDLWGHGELSERLHRLPDGSLLVLVGSPHGTVSWAALPAAASAPEGAAFEIPWEGRVVLLKISPDGRRWTLWNDWVGSIPVFHATAEGGRAASTLEPVLTAAVKATADDISLPGLLSLLINGHTVGDQTLVRSIHVVASDSVTTWDDNGQASRRLWTVVPGEDRAEESWDDLVDQMYEHSRAAIAETLSAAPRWILPLSGGLDSRLIAAVGASLGVEAHAYAWGSPDTADVVHSRQVARALDIPWKGIELGSDYLVRYTQQWARMFGGTLHFHGMYQMAFLDAIADEPPAPILTGYVGDIVSAHPLVGRGPTRYQLYDEWYTHWSPAELHTLLTCPVGDALEELASDVTDQVQALPGTAFKRSMLAEAWSRQRVFSSFQSTLSDYWRGVGTPLAGRAYARFCLSLPRGALDGRRLLADVYRRHYPRMAVIPGTYGTEPFIRTGRYLLMKRLADALPAGLRVGALRGFRTVDPRMDTACVQAHGWDALWPLQEARRELADWMDLSKIDAAYREVMTDSRDVRPLRKLQSVQAFACQLLHS